MAANANWVAHLTHYSLAELRRRQRIVAAQTVAAYKLAQQPDTRPRGLRALEDLQEMADSLTEAVMIRYCPKTRAI